ncbi:MAG: galactose-1-phosphate uridylyltransferase [archaeon]
MKEVNEFRKDYLLNEWTTVVSKRAKRPSDIKKASDKKVKRKGVDKSCPFCPGNEFMTPPESHRIERKGKWSMRVVGNKYSALGMEKKFFSERKGIYWRKGAHGIHEVVIETPSHSKDLADLSEKEISELFRVFKERTRELMKKKDIKYVFCFKNHGRECGTSLEHSHSQIIGFPFIPGRIEMEINESRKYFRRERKCIFCEVVKKEGKSRRKVRENESFIAIAPFASKWPYEYWVLSKKHKSSLSEMSEKELIDLGKIMKYLLKKMKSILHNPAYNFVLHCSMKGNACYHFHIEVYPNIDKKWGGIEKGTGVILNEAPPEMAAMYLGERT